MSIGTLVLLRHGESVWNAENLFTGWVDVDLSERGEAEARRGGQFEVILHGKRRGRDRSRERDVPSAAP